MLVKGAPGVIVPLGASACFGRYMDGHSRIPDMYITALDTPLSNVAMHITSDLSYESAIRT